MTLPAGMIPIRVRIMNVVVAALKEIAPAAGYHNDLRGDSFGRESVVRGRIAIGNDEPLPFVTVIEPPLAAQPINTRRQPDNTVRVTEFDVLVQGWVEDDETPGDQAYLLCAEVCRRLAIEKRRPDARPGSQNAMTFFGLGRSVFEMTIGSPVVRPSETVTGQSVFYLILTFKIGEDMASPFG